jgi:hypothetical protein
MESNGGINDNFLRTLISIFIFTQYFSDLISGNVAVILISLASILILTCLISFCPFYYSFGFSTRNKE